MSTNESDSDFSALAEIIRNHQRIAIISHARPDGDAIGSTLSLGYMLMQMGKEVVMLNEDKIPENISFLAGVEQIKQSTGEPIEVDLAISVDNGDRRRQGELSQKSLANVKTWANIDHHQTNDRFADVNYVESTACATGLVLYKFFKYLGVEITPVMRDALYVAISTDTGSFQYKMTNAEVMRAVADLIDLGVDVVGVNRELYHEKPWEKILLQREVLNGMELSEDGKVCTFCLTAEVKKKVGCKPEDTEGLIDIIRCVKGVMLAAVLEEYENDFRIRVSLRSKIEGLSVAKVAESLGGGGHAMAAGVRIPAPLPEAHARIKQAFTKAIAEFQSNQ
ncbi:MAG: DHH family phosphoesterase [Akkermansia sp.]|nr:DHH family phosphoesterase [Akkermansia sp.]